MRILVVSGELISGDLSWRLAREGNEVKLFVEHELQADCQKGFVERVSNWRNELRWVGKEGLIVFDDVGYGEEQDRLRKDGYRVFGGSAGGDRLEKDREYGQEVLRSVGLNVEPTLNFDRPQEAMEYVRAHPAAYVVKQNTHQSALNYVGEFDDGRDVLSMLGKYEIVGIREMSIQKKIYGIEMAVGRFFNGNDWIGPISVNFEHKALFNGDIGPKTGEMGTLLWYDENEANKLFQAILNPLKEYLISTGYKGDIDVNCIVNADGAYPIDITARLGCPIMHLQENIHLSPWSEFLSAVADGRQYDLQYRKGYGIVLTLALPPFPYEEISDDYSSDGLEIFFRQKLTDEERSRVHFEGARVETDETGLEKFFVTKSIGYAVFVSGIGESVESARNHAQVLASKIVIPKIFYRTDIGDRFVKSDYKQLKEWGWL